MKATQTIQTHLGKEASWRSSVEGRLGKKNSHMTEGKVQGLAQQSLLLRHGLHLALLPVSFKQVIKLAVNLSYLLLTILLWTVYSLTATAFIPHLPGVSRQAAWQSKQSTSPDSVLFTVVLQLCSLFHPYAVSPHLKCSWQIPRGGSSFPSHITALSLQLALYRSCFHLGTQQGRMV